MTKINSPRYTICTITTKDINLREECERVRQDGYTYEDILRAGLEALSK